MTWLALRLLRPYLIVAATLAAAATAYLVHAAGVVRRQLDAAGLPDCVDPNYCYPQGAALDAVLGMELTAAFVPPLIALILGVALFARERESGTTAFVLTQSVSRRRWVLTKLGWALAAAVTCTGTVALVFRLVATRYTAIASDTYELLQLLHLNNAAYMVAQSALLVALAGIIGLSVGRTLQTLILTAVSGPVALALAAGIWAMLATGIAAVTGPIDTAAAEGFASERTYFDPFAYPVSVVVVLGVLGLVLLAPKVGAET
ncbi:ABC transporter permease subunit [Actinoplanes sp. NPDC051859]|uniref:ABC transporter permease subunit n=1 Tax=Actinoplanes sp. NPDC051859 TaxID=3363909 RepID=UPI0037B9000F